VGDFPSEGHPSHAHPRHSVRRLQHVRKVFDNNKPGAANDMFQFGMTSQN
jgi:hypothetical protein